jgi:hypothetical protein
MFFLCRSIIKTGSKTTCSTLFQVLCKVGGHGSEAAVSGKLV